MMKMGDFEVAREIYRPVWGMEVARATGNPFHLDAAVDVYGGSLSPSPRLHHDFDIEINDPREAELHYGGLRGRRIDVLGASLLKAISEGQTVGEANGSDIDDVESGSIQNCLDETRRMIGRAASDQAITALVERYPLPEAMKARLLNYRSGTILGALVDAPDDDVVEFVKWNAGFIHEENVRHQPYMAEIVAEFQDRLTSTIKRELIGIDHDETTRKISGVTLGIGDPIFLGVNGMSGCYSGEENKIYIAWSDDDSWTKHIVFHEMFHHLSGRELITVSEHITDNMHVVGTEYVRSGLELRTTKMPAHRWVNEAVTEYLTLLLAMGCPLKYGDVSERRLHDLLYYGSYIKERRHLIATMRSAEATLEPYIDAYFEDLNPGAQDMSQNQKKLWKALGRVVPDFSVS